MVFLPTRTVLNPLRRRSDSPHTSAGVRGAPALCELIHPGSDAGHPHPFASVDIIWSTKLAGAFADNVVGLARASLTSRRVPAANGGY